MMETEEKMTQKTYYSHTKEIFWNIHEAELDYNTKKQELSNHLKKIIQKIEWKIKGSTLGNNIDEFVRIVNNNPSFSTSEEFFKNVNIQIKHKIMFWKKLNDEEKEFVWNLAKNQYKKKDAEKNKLLELKMLVKRQLDFITSTTNFLNRFILTLTVEVDAQKSENYFQNMKQLLEKINIIKYNIENENESLMKSDLTSYLYYVEEEKKLDQIDLELVNYITDLSKKARKSKSPKINSVLSAACIITSMFSEQIEKEHAKKFKEEKRIEKENNKQKSKKHKKKHRRN